MKKQEERQNRLFELLQLNGRLDVKTVCSELSISEATARRLFQELSNEGKLIRIHGGVQLAPQSGFDYSYRQESLKNSDLKTGIGNAAARRVNENENIFLDSGTTVMKMAEALAIRLRLKQLNTIVVLTNSFTVVEILARHAKVLVTGGEARVERRDVCGSVAESMLNRFHIDKAFIGADAIHAELGLMTTDERTARMNEIVIQHSFFTYVLADHHKFSKSSFTTYAGFADINMVFTDTGLSKQLHRQFKKAGATVELISS